MSAPLRTSCLDQQPEFVQERFLAMLPQIRRQAAVALRDLRAEVRQELTQEAVANAYCAFVQLVGRGHAAVAYPTPLAQYALRQVRSGRQVGCRLNVNDILSPYARRIQHLTIERLDQRAERTGQWSQLLVEDRRTGPAETAAARLDVAAWFGTLSGRNRRIAKALAAGESTGVVARQFGLSPGRISQLRTWFRDHWEQFQGTTQTVGGAA